MGEELSDMEINYAQQLLKANHPKFNGFQSTLVVRKIIQFENSVQIHSSLCSQTPLDFGYDS